MKSILNVAIAELKQIIYSPLAWVSTLVLLLLFSTQYITTLSSYLPLQLQGGMALLELESLTHKLTVTCPFAAWFMRMLMVHTKFVFPFIMMGVLSREYATGTIKLIYSAPLSIRAFVWGKFVGMMGFCLIIVGLFSVLVVAFCFSIASPEVGLLCWQLVCFFLYYVFLSSICLFASSLSPYAIVGGAISVVLIILLNLLGSVGLATDMADFFYPLSHQSAILRLIHGVIDLNDLIFLLVLTLLFVQLTIIRVQGSATGRSPWRQGAYYAGSFLVAFLFIAILPYSPLKLLNIRRDNVGALRPTMQQVLKQMDQGPLEVTHYVNIIFPEMPYYLQNSPYSGRPGIKYNSWRDYLPYKKDINVRFKYYYSADTTDLTMRQIIKSYGGKSVEEIANIMAYSYGFNMDEVMTLEEAQQEVDIIGNGDMGQVVKLAYNGRDFTVLAGVGGDIPGSLNYYPAFRYLISGKPEKALFVLDGKTREMFHGSRDAYAITGKRSAFSWDRFGPKTDSIRLTVADVPDTTHIVLVMAPRQELPVEALSKLKEIIDRGGNLLIAGEPGFHQFINPLLEYVGISLKKEIVVQPTPNVGSGSIQAHLSKPAYSYMPRLDSALRRLKSHQLNIDTTDVVFYGATALDVSQVSGFEIVPMVYSRAGSSWNRTSLSDYDSLNLVLPMRVEDEAGAQVLMALLTREIHGRTQRILVAGDVDYLNHRVTNSFGATRPSNQSFNQSMLEVLSNGVYPVNLAQPRLPDNRFTITNASLRIQQAAFVYGFPGVLLMLGVIFFIKRKRK